MSKTHDRSAQLEPIAVQVDEMEIQTRLNAEQGTDADDADSPLSDVPPSPDEVKDSEDPASNDPNDSDTSMSGQNSNDSDNDDALSIDTSESGSDMSSQYDDLSDEDFPPIARRKIPQRVIDIEEELGLRALQGDQFHNLMRALMLSAGLLGNMDFRSRNKAHNIEVLRPIFETVLNELEFLGKAKVSKARLNELLVARARISNSNELHARWMLKKGKVQKRADGTVYVPEEEEHGVAQQQDDVEEEQGVQQPDMEAEQHVVEHQKVEERGQGVEQQHISDEEQGVEQHQGEVEEQGTVQGPRPSVVAADLAGLFLGGDAVVEPEMQENQTPPLSPMQIDGPEEILVDEQDSEHDHPTLPTHNQATAPRPTVFHPTAFIIRVVNSTTGAAVHTSQLVTAGQASVDSLSYETFLSLVSQQMGFNVQGRISAVLPKFHAVAPFDSLVGLASEATWRAVLQAWQNTRRRTCELVVEA